MINNLIFDFGDVFLNLDKPAIYRGLKEEELQGLNDGFYELSCKIETGMISNEEFILGLQEFLPGWRTDKLKRQWNSILLDLPEYRLQFLETLSEEGKQQLFLLSNTNALHIEHIIDTIGQDKYERFQACFDAFYLSHEIGMRKPDEEIYKFVLDKHGLKASETLFIDDTEANTLSAQRLGIKTWNIQPGAEDITELKNRFLND